MGRRAEKDILEVSHAEIEAVRQRIEASDLPDRDKQIILTLLEEIVTIKKLAKEKRAYLNRIKRMLEKQSEKRPSANTTDGQGADTPEEKQESDEKPAQPKPKNHGRLSADDYKTSETVTHVHQELHPGQKCPDCGHGTLQPYRPRRFIRLTGQAPIKATLHEVEQLRCGGCEKIFAPQLPIEVGEEKADASANAIVATFRLGMGIPHYRLATIQKVLGVPIPASTQYEMLEYMWTHATPVFKELLRQAADCPLMFYDDTPAKILDLLKENEDRRTAGQRVGIFTTAIVAQRESREIHLFFTGRKHAGENLNDLLNHRDSGLSPPNTMSDAASRNDPKDHLTIVSLCLVHGRRNFIDCESAFPDEAAYVIERIGLVYKHEKHTKKAGMNDQERLEYHQTHSQQPMDEIKAYAEQKIACKEVETNGTLGHAFQYMLKYWKEMTRFLEVPGAPLDNNKAERLIKSAIMYRKNSLFYKTENGARVGDCLMSLIQTCIANGENPIDYLTALQRNTRHVAKNPQLWFPWNYQNTLRSINPPNHSDAQTQQAANIEAL